MRTHSTHTPAALGRCPTSRPHTPQTLPTVRDKSGLSRLLQNKGTRHKPVGEGSPLPHPRLVPVCESYHNALYFVSVRHTMSHFTSFRASSHVALHFVSCVILSLSNFCGLRALPEQAKARVPCTKRDLRRISNSFLSVKLLFVCIKNVTLPSKKPSKLLTRSQKHIRAFARQNAQFVARFSSFDSETPHRGVFSAQDDALVFAFSNSPTNQNLKFIPTAYKPRPIQGFWKRVWWGF